MSTNIAVLAPPIPSPTDEPQSIVQSIWALKQNVEVAQGTRGAARPNSGYVSSVSTSIGAAIDRAKGV